MKSGTQLISEERYRQISEEGYTEAHDQLINPPGMLLAAGVAYASDALQNYVRNRKLKVINEFIRTLNKMRE